MKKLYGCLLVELAVVVIMVAIGLVLGWSKVTW